MAKKAVLVAALVVSAFFLGTQQGTLQHTVIAAGRLQPLAITDNPNGGYFYLVKDAQSSGCWFVAHYAGTGMGVAVAPPEACK